MCGRYTLQATPDELARQFHVGGVDSSLFTPRYNIAPSQDVAVVRLKPDTSQRELVRLRWGLIPSWAKDLKMAYSTINAKAETVAEKPTFRAAFRQRRCLIPASGFYEWQQQDRQKQPMYICLRECRLFAFAGLWDRWEPKDGEPIESCTIITTEPNELMQSIHNRMPVLVAPKDYDVWLDPSIQHADAIQPLLRPYPADAMTAYPVSRWVNNPRNDDPRCIESMPSI